MDAPRPAPPALPGRDAGSGSMGLELGPRGHLAARTPPSPAWPLPCPGSGAPPGPDRPSRLASPRPQPSSPTSLARPGTCGAANARTPGALRGHSGRPAGFGPVQRRPAPPGTLQSAARMPGVACPQPVPLSGDVGEQGPPGRTSGSGGAWPQAGSFIEGWSSWPPSPTSASSGPPPGLLARTSRGGGGGRGSAWGGVGSLGPARGLHAAELP